jgi:hypothetical protein
MKKIIKLNENDIVNLINKVLSEQVGNSKDTGVFRPTPRPNHPGAPKPLPRRKPKVTGPMHTESYDEMNESYCPPGYYRCSTGCCKWTVKDVLRRVFTEEEMYEGSPGSKYLPKWAKKIRDFVTEEEMYEESDRRKYRNGRQLDWWLKEDEMDEEQKEKIKNICMYCYHLMLYF